MPTGRRRLASSLRAAEPSSPNEAKALSNIPPTTRGDEGFVLHFCDGEKVAHRKTEWIQSAFFPSARTSILSFGSRGRAPSASCPMS